MFTDDDLNRVKKACTKLHGPVGINGAYVLPLIARLEAAENCAGYLGSLAVLDTTMEVLLKEWRKSKGLPDGEGK